MTSSDTVHFLDNQRGNTMKKAALGVFYRDKKKGTGPGPFPMTEGVTANTDKTVFRIMRFENKKHPVY